MRNLGRYVASVAVSILLINPVVSADKSDDSIAKLRLESFAIALDPAFIADTQSRRIADMIHAKLLQASGQGGYQGEIAEKWEWKSKDTLQISIGRNFTFSDGRAITAYDAAWSICRLIQPNSPSRWLFDNIKHSLSADNTSVDCTGIRVLGTHLLEIQISSSQSQLISALATTTAAIVPENSEPGAYGVVPGAGPYVVEKIEPNARIVLRSRRGGPIIPGYDQVVFRLVQDDATTASLFSNGDLDVIEIGNPTLYQLMFAESAFDIPVRMFSSEVEQVRLLIFNETAIGEKLELSPQEVREWVRAFQNRVDADVVAGKFSPLLIPMRTAYFPAHGTGRVTEGSDQQITESAPLTIITENDSYSDRLAATVVEAASLDRLNYVGLEKSVLIGRLIQRDYDIAGITLEALASHPVYWLSFFKPGSPFTVFGKPIQGLLSPDELGSRRHNQNLIDNHGNWQIIARERRIVIARLNVTGMMFHQTGLVNYAAIAERP